MAGNSCICNFRKNIVVFVVLVILFFVCETCMRMFFTPRFVNPEFCADFTPDYEYGYDDKPLFFRRGDMLIRWIEGNYNRVQYKLLAEKPDDEFRIFLIGSSVLGSAEDSSVGFYLEQILKFSSDEGIHKRKFVVINLGTPGLAPDQLLIVVKKSVRYKPDLIVVNIATLQNEDLSRLELFREAHRFPMGILTKSKLFCFLDKFCKRSIVSSPLHAINALRLWEERSLMLIVKAKPLFLKSRGSYDPQTWEEVKQAHRSVYSWFPKREKRFLESTTSYSLIKIMQSCVKKSNTLASTISKEKTVHRSEKNISPSEVRFKAQMAELHDVVRRHKIHLLHVLTSQQPVKVAVINSDIFKNNMTKRIASLISVSAMGNEYIHSLDSPRIFAENSNYFSDPRAMFSDDRHWVDGVKILVAREIAQFVKKDFLKESRVIVPEYPYFRQKLGARLDFRGCIGRMILYEQEPGKTRMEELMLSLKRVGDLENFYFGSTERRVGKLLFKDDQEESKLRGYCINFVNGWIKAKGYSSSDEY